MMKYSKNYDYSIGFGSVGALAYKLNKVWRLGFHLFECDTYLIFRICFFRSKYSTYYWQISKKIRKHCACMAESEVTERWKD